MGTLGCSTQSSSQPLPPLNIPNPMARFMEQAIPIEAIHNQPEINQTTTIQGTIQQRVPLLNGWLYQVQDQTGLIWVLTTTSPPSLGTHVIVRGNIQYESVLMGGVDIGESYLDEVEVTTTESEAPSNSPDTHSSEQHHPAQS